MYLLYIIDRYRLSQHIFTKLNMVLYLTAFPFYLSAKALHTRCGTVTPYYRVLKRYAMANTLFDISCYSYGQNVPKIKEIRLVYLFLYKKKLNLADILTNNTNSCNLCSQQNYFNLYNFILCISFMGSLILINFLSFPVNIPLLWYCMSISVAILLVSPIIPSRQTHVHLNQGCTYLLYLILLFFFQTRDKHHP